MQKFKFNLDVTDDTISLIDIINIIGSLNGSVQNINDLSNVYDLTILCDEPNAQNIVKALYGDDIDLKDLNFYIYGDK